MNNTFSIIHDKKVISKILNRFLRCTSKYTITLIIASSLLCGTAIYSFISYIYVTALVCLITICVLDLTLLIFTFIHLKKSLSDNASSIRFDERSFIVDETATYKYSSIISIVYFKNYVGIRLLAEIYIIDTKFIDKNQQKSFIDVIRHKGLVKRKRALPHSLIAFVLGIVIFLEIQGFTNQKYIGKLETYSQELEAKYNIKIYYKESLDNSSASNKLEYDNNYRLLYTDLCEVDTVFSELPDGFFNEMIDYINKSKDYIADAPMSMFDFKLILCSSIKDSQTNESLGGYSTGFSIAFNGIALKTSSPDTLRKTLYHELSHAIDKKLLYLKASFIDTSAYTDWNKCNPQNFIYSKNHPQKQYILNENSDNNDDICCVSEYGASNEGEDRAELFKLLMTLESKEEFDKYYRYKYVHKKINYMDSLIDDAFECINKENHFKWQEWVE